MSQPDDRPPVVWLLSSGERRARATKYWIEDVAIGIVDLAIHYGLRLLPLDACSRVGIYLGKWGSARFPEGVERAQRAWRKLRPQDDAEAARAAVERLWRCVGRTMAEYSVLRRIWPAGRVSVEGIEHLDAVRVAGRRRIVMGLHLGNWEVIPPTLIALGHPGSGIYLRPNNRFDHFIVRQVRRAYGAQLISPDVNATRESARILKSGEGYIIFVDELIRGRVQSPALGRELRTSGTNLAYVARLAMMTDAAVLPVYCIRDGDQARFKMRVLPPVELVATGNRRADIAANVARLDAVIDPLIRAHLNQWFYLLDLELDEEAQTAPPPAGAASEAAG